MIMKLTIVDWIRVHAAHGSRETVVTLEGSLMVCPCGATHVYSIDSLLDDQQQAIDNCIAITEGLNIEAQEHMQNLLMQMKK